MTDVTRRRASAAVRSLLPYLAVLLAFLAMHLLTEPRTIGDTTRYAADTVRHANGEPSQFWEFGHLLWRPWGYAGLKAFGPLFAQRFGDDDFLAVIRFLTLTNYVAACLSLLLLQWLLLRVAPLWISFLTVLAFMCSNAFLSYSRSGSSYIPALLFLMLAFCLLVRSAERPGPAPAYALAGGFSFAISAALWFPYALVGLGLIAVVLLWGGEAAAPQRVRSAVTFLIATAVVTLVVFGFGLDAKGIRSFQDVKQWVLESDNAWSQAFNAVRLTTGLPRAVYDLGDDPVRVKRWFFDDPYNPVRAADLPVSLLAKLSLFYLGCLLVLHGLIQLRALRPLFLMLSGAFVPLLIFAVFFFEPGSPERYLPVLPWFYLCVAAVLGACRNHRIVAVPIIVCLLSSLALNIPPAARWRLAEEKQSVLLRKAALEDQISAFGTVFVLTFRDGLYALPNNYPLDRSLRCERFAVVDVIEIASERILRWRAEFAQRALSSWSMGREVWLSSRLFSARPESSWLWVEGDDKRVSWAGIPAFFSQFQTDLVAGEPGDGFRRLAPAAANRALLQQIESAADR